MSDKKNIDRLFQEKFKDFEAKPNAKVWENIQNQLEQPVSKPRVIPLWIRLAGIAALLALLFSLGNAFIGNTTTEGNKKTVVETNINEDLNTSDNSSETDNSTNTVVSENDIINKNNRVNPEVSNETLNNNATVSKVNNDSNTPNKASSHSESNKNNSATQKAIQNKKKVSPNSNNIQSQYASSSQQNNVNSSTNTSQRITATNKTQRNNDSPLYAQNNIKSASDHANVTDIKNEVNSQNNSIDNNSINTNPSNEVLAQTNTEEEKTNMNPKDEDAQTPNPLEEATLANTEDSIEKEEEETVMNRWTVNANVAPVYYNTLGKGSHIHDQFINNPKNGEINTSYGINVGYAVNNKLKVRSGINKLNLSYDTADVIIYENVSNTPSSAPLKNINFVPTNSGENISVLSASSLSVQQVGGGVLSDGLNAALSQRISYVEVPVELEYAIVNKRVGVHLIGGVSTLILEGNEVVTEVENRKTKIGEANNINNVSFTTNLGLGIDYKFNDKLKFNIEPTFKYQINAYNETSGNFKPYIIGVYTGFSYKF